MKVPDRVYESAEKRQEFMARNGMTQFKYAETLVLSRKSGFHSTISADRR